MRDIEPEQEDNKNNLNFNLLMPAAMLLVLLMVPFSINTLMHFLAAKNQFANPLIMKIPVDSSAITIPSELTQYESFEISLNLDTRQLAGFLNEIVSTASEGASVQGVVGEVSPNMRAEITGKSFRTDHPGPQEQLYIFNDVTRWTWHVVPESSGIQKLTFRLHLMTYNGSQQGLKIVDLAEANLSVQANPSQWLLHNWGWIILLLLIPAGWIIKRRYVGRS